MSSLSQALERYDGWRTAAYQWRQELSVPAKIGLALLVAAATAVAAHIRFHVPGTPVPVTGQVFMVLLAGVVLGGRYGALSQVFYLSCGAAGLPIFTVTAGSGALIGITGGYLLGFLPAALFIGLMVDNVPACRRPAGLFSVMLAGVGIIYGCGALQYSFFMHTNLTQTILGAVVPFIALDVGKAVVASMFALAFLPANKSD